MSTFQGWLNHRPPQEADVLLGLFDSIFEDILNFVVQKLVAKMDVLQCMQIRQTCDLLQGLIPSKEEKGTVSKMPHYF